MTPAFGGQTGVYGTLGIPPAANVPGGRSGAIGWTDSSGNFWLFGGQGYDSGNSGLNNAGYLNDLWEFNPSTNEWTWMGGSSTLPCNDVCGQPGAYGTLGNASAANIPGGREKRSVGPIAAATSGSSAGWVLPRRVPTTFSMTYGSSIPPPTNGPGWAETLRSIPAEANSTAVGPEYTVRRALPPQGTILEVGRWR